MSMIGHLLLDGKISLQNYKYSPNLNPFSRVIYRKITKRPEQVPGRLWFKVCDRVPHGSVYLMTLMLWVEPSL